MIYGALTDDGYGIGTPFKSSRIGKDVGYEALQRYYERSKTVLKEPGALDGLRGKIADGMARSSSRAEFCERLHDTGVDAVFRLNAVGRIYGVTFIDHGQGIVANGSLLGRSFSANALEQQFHAEAKSSGVSREPSEQERPSSKNLSGRAIYPSAGRYSGIDGCASLRRTATSLQTEKKAAYQAIIKKKRMFVFIKHPFLFWKDSLSAQRNPIC